MDGRHLGDEVATTDVHPWDVDAVNWDWVASGVREARADYEARAAQITIEARISARQPRLAEQEARAQLQAGVDACEELLAAIDGMT
jgi:hypothetical protein